MGNVVPLCNGDPTVSRGEGHYFEKFPYTKYAKGTCAVVDIWNMYNLSVCVEGVGCCLGLQKLLKAVPGSKQNIWAPLNKTLPLP